MPRLRYVATWVAAEGDVIFAPETLVIFEMFTQHKHKREAGGILLGYRRGAHLDVVQATPPSIHDERRIVSFVRTPRVHQEIATSAWSNSGGRIDHVGEWHTHSERHPTPSFVDKCEWAKLAQQRSPSAPMLGVIVGTESLYVARIEHDGRITVCMPGGGPHRDSSGSMGDER
jgi:integrative and conjugative element protein (TIGR02256 family)